MRPRREATFPGLSYWWTTPDEHIFRATSNRYPHGQVDWADRWHIPELELKVYPLAQSGDLDVLERQLRPESVYPEGQLGATEAVELAVVMLLGRHTDPPRSKM